MTVDKVFLWVDIKQQSVTIVNDGILTMGGKKIKSLQKFVGTILLGTSGKAWKVKEIVLDKNKKLGVFWMLNNYYYISTKLLRIEYNFEDLKNDIKSFIPENNFWNTEETTFDGNFNNYLMAIDKCINVIDYINLYENVDYDNCLDIMV